jgi:hypothetical protein
MFPDLTINLNLGLTADIPALIVVSVLSIATLRRQGAKKLRRRRRSRPTKK